MRRGDRVRRVHGVHLAARRVDERALDGRVIVEVLVGDQEPHAAVAETIAIAF
jgi:hypothetical protein